MYFEALAGVVDNRTEIALVVAGEFWIERHPGLGAHELIVFVDLFAVAVHEFHEQEIAELLIGGGGALGPDIGKVLSEARADFRVGEFRNLLVGHAYILGNGVFKFRLHAADVGNHERIAVVGLVGYVVVNPEVGVPVESVHVAMGELGRSLAHTAEHGEVNARIGVVGSEPEEAAEFGGHIVAELSYKREAGLLGGYGAFMGVFHRIDLERHRTPAVGNFVWTGTNVVGHIVGGTLEMVAHGPLHVGGRERFLGFYPKWHRVAFGAVDPGQVFVHPGREKVEIGPYACVATTQRAEIGHAVSLGKVEFLVFPVEIALRPGELNYIRAVKGLAGFVLEREAVDAGMVGVAGYMAVGNAAGDPYGALVGFPFADEVHYPGLFAVGYGEGFSLGGIAVSFTRSVITRIASRAVLAR